MITRITNNELSPTRITMSRSDPDKSGPLNSSLRITDNAQRNTEQGFTLIELLITISLFVVLFGVATYTLRVVLIAWSGVEKRAGIDIGLGRGFEETVRDLRGAKVIQSAVNYDEIRFSEDNSTYYIYYLYNPSDSYIPPPAFDQELYQLKKAQLTGGINGTFSYGLGQIIIKDIIPPPVSDLSYESNIVTIDISSKTADEIIRSKTQVRPRNL